MLGEIAFRLNQRKRALRFLEKAAAIEPDDPSNELVLDIVRNADTGERAARPAPPRPAPPRPPPRPAPAAAKPQPRLFAVPPARAKNLEPPPARPAAPVRPEIPIVIEPLPKRPPAVAMPSPEPVPAEPKFDHRAPDTIPEFKPDVPSQAPRPLPASPLFSQRPGRRLRQLVVGGLLVAGAAVLVMTGVLPTSRPTAPLAGAAAASAAGALAGVPSRATEAKGQSAVPSAAAPGTAQGAPTDGPGGLDPRWAEVIARDTWLHPLSGPVRRMPIRDARVFGAERPGDRPGECRNGHCGVDLGETWGEPVLAAHAGIVDRVQRGPNPEHGGLYVRIAHRGGTVFTQYFHLAAIPRRVQPGVQIKAGDVIGLVGDTGIHSTGPHLHFTLSVRMTPQGLEQYIDPEPLIALWPLRVPDGPGSALLDASAAPGMPRGPAARHKRKRRAPASPAEAAPSAAPADAPSAD